MEKSSSEDCVCGDSSSDDSVNNRAGISIPMPEHTTTSMKLPLWMRILAKLPINPQIPDFLEKRFPALMGLICYGYLPNMLVLGYVNVTVCIMVYFTFPIAHILLALIYVVPCLVALAVDISRFLRWCEAQRRGFRWDMDKLLDEYMTLIQKKQR